jgi:hypothetical protein
MMARPSQLLLPLGAVREPPVLPPAVATEIKEIVAALLLQVVVSEEPREGTHEPIA